LHAIIKEALFSNLSNLVYPLHRQDGLAHQITIILDRTISALFKVKGRIHSHFFSSCLTVGLCPGYLAWVSFLGEIAVTFGTAKSETFAIITDKHHSMTGIARRGTEVAFFNSHDGVSSG
jgi:hypothetical protein